MEKSLAKRVSLSEFAGTTRLLVLQPTPFCNINCSYCYLPARADRHCMSFDIVEAAVRFVFDSGLAASDIAVVWHAGEPLVLPPAWYREAFARIARVAGEPRAGQFRPGAGGMHGPVDRGANFPTDASAAGYKPIAHVLQTNGMLIDHAWCDFFLENDVQVGVSLDGPARLHDARRRTRSGAGTHASVMRGIAMLRRHGVPFDVICVVSEAALDSADELMDFFIAEKIPRVGFNIEEVEGTNRTSTLQGAAIEHRFRAFFARILARAAAADPPVLIREEQDVMAHLRDPAFGRHAGNAENTPFRIITVSSRGALFTFSPELAGIESESYGTMAIGQLPGATLESVTAGPLFQRMRSDVAMGVAACRATCRYFDLCLGGAPANKLGELGTFAASETMYCQLAHQCVADVTLAQLEQNLQHQASSSAPPERAPEKNAARSG